MTEDVLRAALTDEVLGELVCIAGSHPGRRWDAVKERMRDVLVVALTPSAEAPRDPLEAFCQSKDPAGKNMCILPRGHAGYCGWLRTCPDCGSGLAVRTECTYCIDGSAPTPSPEGPATALQTAYYEGARDMRDAIFNDQPFDGEHYPHLLICNGNHFSPLGTEGEICNCMGAPLFQRLEKQAKPPLSGDSPGAWQDISTAPKGVAVLTIDASKQYSVPQVATCGKKHGRWATVPGAYQIRPTHWHKLPDTSALPSPPPASSATQEPR